MMVNSEPPLYPSIIVTKKIDLYGPELVLIPYQLHHCKHM